MSFRRRKFWQIHLSTVLLVIVACGGLVHVNFREVWSWSEWRPHGASYKETYWHLERGWPATIQRDHYKVDEYEAAPLDLNDPLKGLRYSPSNPPPKDITGKHYSDWSDTGFAINIVTALVILVVLTLVSENAVRRRSKP